MEKDRWQFAFVGQDTSKYDKLNFIKDKVYSIGRHRDCTMILKNMEVSRKHCLVRKKADRLEILDKSENGTYVNSMCLKGVKTPHMLQDGDMVGFAVPARKHVGDFVFRVKHHSGKVLTKREVAIQNANIAGLSGISSDARKILERSDDILEVIVNQKGPKIECIDISDDDTDDDICIIKTILNSNRKLT